MAVATPDWNHPDSSGRRRPHPVLVDPQYPEPLPGPRTRRRDEVAVAGHGMVQFLCAGQLPEPRVQFEIWTSEPPDPPDQELGFTGEFETHHPRVVLGAPTGAPADMKIDLERRYPGRPYVGDVQR